ncbi:phosphate propanoyltransferase [Pseudaeromonas sp. ZJS20]|uniref:phosphate propanoyltransferase n=1 Tax=Pseudaeromonas aegiceratis TaxID=3153928 RepID=UPI00390C6A05
MQEQQVREAISNVLEQMRQRPIPLGISNRHVHLSASDYQALFPNEPLTVRKELLQPGQYAAEQTVTLSGPKGFLKNVRILGPLRSRTQVEISKTDARSLGVAAPLRLSGQLEQSPGIKLISPYGELSLAQGVIVALRHIHMSPLDALVYGVQQGDRVKVAIAGSGRTTVFDDVAIRVSPQMTLEMHIDTDEANAAGADDPAALIRLVRE